MASKSVVCGLSLADGPVSQGLDVYDGVREHIWPAGLESSHAPPDFAARRHAASDDADLEDPCDLIDWEPEFVDTEHG